MAAFAMTGPHASRAKAFGFAASIAMAAYVAAPSASLAQDLIPAAVKASLPPACLKLHGAVAQLDCGTAYNKKLTAAAEARGAEADARSAAALKSIQQSDKIIETASAAKSCYDSIMQEVLVAKKTGPLTPEQKAGFKTRAAACEKT